MVAVTTHSRDIFTQHLSAGFDIYSTDFNFTGVYLETDSCSYKRGHPTQFIEPVLADYKALH